VCIRQAHTGFIKTIKLEIRSRISRRGATQDHQNLATALQQLVRHTMDEPYARIRIRMM